MDHVRIGIIGVGGMGSFHARYLLEGCVARASLTAVSDADPARLEPYKELKTFTDSRDLIRSGAVDAVLIATPHYYHTTIGCDALEQGLHVLVEKPISVHKADAERLIAAHRRKDQVFAAMFQQRTTPHYKEIKRLVSSGELGRIQRACWIITDWFRPEAYYASGTWRATWKGEGGGVLVNQCPHNLDIFQWIVGMPVRVRAFCGLGKYHDIEVEDEVTAYFEYENGATAVLVTSTGEAPGTNRLEIAGDLGKLVLEFGQLTFYRNEVPASEFSRTSPAPFSKPGATRIEIPVAEDGGQHVEITQNFVDAILDGVPLIAPAEEGIRSVELANAMLYSHFTGQTVELPLDGAAYEAFLQGLIATSRQNKRAPGAGPVTDMASSFQKP
ncbi:MAG: Gfo/Idh/MocA family oxidoreductase [Anaerolineae bacterium]|nr:Gfo/Idh/MocA family oxidoreductase [Anaerolineae bacterium]